MCKCRISSYSFCKNYSFLNLEIVVNSNSCHNISFLYLKTESLLQKLFKFLFIAIGEKVRGYLGLKSFITGSIGTKHHKWKHLPIATALPFHLNGLLRIQWFGQVSIHHYWTLEVLSWDYTTKVGPKRKITQYPFGYRLYFPFLRFKR